MSAAQPLHLRTGELQAMFLPARGMLCASLRHRGQEILRRLERPRAAAASGVAVGIPLLHPWANRLAGLAYRAAAREVSIDAESPLLHYDANALLLHGVPWSRLRWHVESASDTRIAARLHWHTPGQLAVFPFEHTLQLEVTLDDSSLGFETRLQSSADEAVPVSFGFHPYLGLPGTPRERWKLSLPTMQRLHLNRLGLPDGHVSTFDGDHSTLAGRSLDDHYALLAGTAEFAIEDNERRIAVELLHGYTHAQVYAPAGHDYIALEPMTAPVNALCSGDGLRVLAPGQQCQAGFRVGFEQ